MKLKSDLHCCALVFVVCVSVEKKEGVWEFEILQDLVRILLRFCEDFV
ncbi:hypothetical protein HanIR_Chr08g0366481 [Helianthus annuus]|nr:hypothetical protein HanIR_Chr08g0366481 [Helianthus annuus]